MPHTVPESHLDLFKKRSLAYLATLMADGSPHVTPVWIDYDGEHLLVNTSSGRVKDRNMRKRPHVGLTVQDPDDPYRYLSIQGPIIATVEDADGARVHINALSQRYTGKAVYETRLGELRRIFKIRPEKVVARG